MMTCTISSNFCKKRFSASTSLLDSFIEDFFFIPFQQKNEIKRKYPNEAQISTFQGAHFKYRFVLRQRYKISKKNLTDDNLIRKYV